MTLHFPKSPSEDSMTRNHEPARREFVPDLPDEAPSEPERFRVYADQRNPDLGRALMWGTVILMSLATWAVIGWVIS